MSATTARRQTTPATTGAATTGAAAAVAGDLDQLRADTDELRAELAELTSTMCRALTDPKRLHVLYLLGRCPMSVGELCEVIGAPQANVSQHLGVLRDRGLVEARRDGNRVVYSLRHPRVLDAVDILRRVMADEATRRQGVARRF